MAAGLNLSGSKSYRYTAPKGAHACVVMCYRYTAPKGADVCVAMCYRYNAPKGAARPSCDVRG
jgi:hypothetical protein